MTPPAGGLPQAARWAATIGVYAASSQTPTPERQHVCNSRSTHFAWAVLTLVLGAGCALRLYGLDRSLWFDEIYGTRVMLGSLHDLAVQALTDVHPPLYAAIMFVWIRLFSDGEIAMRVLPVLAGIGSIALTYAVGSTVTSRWTAVVAAGLVALSPVQIWYSQEARLYALAQFWLLLAVFAYQRSKTAQDGSHWLPIYAAAIVCATFSHFYLALAAAVMAAVAALEPHRHSRWIVRASLAALVAMAIFVGVKIAAQSFMLGKQYLRPFTLRELWLVLFNWYLLGNSVWRLDPYDVATSLRRYPAMLATQALAAVVFIRGFWKFNLVDRRMIGGLILATPAALLVATAFGLHYVYIERSLFFGLPFFFIAIAAGVEDLGRMTDAARGMLVVGAVVVLISFWQTRTQWNVYKPHADWRSAAAYLDAEMSRSHDCCEVLAVTRALELRYYRPAAAQPVRVDAADVSSLCARARTSTFYLVKDLFRSDDFEPLFAATRRDPACRLDVTESFFGLTIYKFSRDLR
jgi:hypothetical protein